MDNSSGATNNDISQQLENMSSPIVSTLTTATPITSEIVSDFEPDPKFEITTLEMASYEDICPSNLMDEHNQHQPLADSNGGLVEQETNLECASHDEQVSTQESQQHNILEFKASQNQQSDANLINSTQPHQGDESEASKKLVDEKLAPSVGVRTNDCAPGISEKDTAAGKMNAKTTEVLVDLPKPGLSVSCDSKIVDCLPQAETVAKRVAKQDSAVLVKESNQLNLELNTSPSTTDRANQNSNTANSYSMTQSSVDAQMEKVIDNIVELGGVHQFPQSLGQPEGKEELLASIHRDITSERSSIDLIADVASRQQSIEITPTILPQPDAVINDMLLKEKNVVSQPILDGDKSEPKSKVPESVVDEEQKEVGLNVVEEQVVEDIVTEERVIEEAADEASSATGEVRDLKEEIVEERISEEIVPPREDAAKEAAKTEEVEEQKVRELTKETPMVVDTEVEAPGLQPKETPEKTKNKPKETHINVVDPRHDEPEKIPDEKVTARRARNATKKTEEPVIEEKITRPRRATRGRKTDEKTTEPHPAPQANESCPPATVEVEEQPKPDLIPSAEQIAEPSTNVDSQETANEQNAEQTVEPTQDGPSADGKRPRSLRPRASLKRTYDEDDYTPREQAPKTEPSKKQLKRARGSIGEPVPMIKLPSYRSRTTISTSDPVSRVEKKHEHAPTTATLKPESSEKKFVCHQCGYATDRLNNLVYHSTKSFCQGKCQIGEVMKADITRQQQQAKNKRRSVR